MTNEEMKIETLKFMSGTLSEFRSKFRVLDALDRDITADGCMDLCDQLSDMMNDLLALESVVERSLKVTGE